MRAAVVDAFTAEPFAGNPAAVVLLPADGPDPAPAWLQAVAREFNLSETAFLAPAGAGRYRLRWFTPTVEVELCGHATLAAAHWLMEQGLCAEEVRFDTVSGTLTARARGDGRVSLDLPAVPLGPVAAPGGLAEALGAPSAEVVGVTGQATQLQRNALVLLTAADLRDLRPDVRALAALPLGGAIVTAPADEAARATGVDVLSRYFCPAVGIPEDPVTGSAYCTLAGYWCERLGRTSFRAAQLSERGGLLDVALDADPARVEVTGSATAVMDVTLR